jgi:hypothetical protein
MASVRWEAVTLVVWLGGCFFDRSGLAVDAAVVRPDGSPADAGPADAGGCVPSTEICDGIDNDCDPTSADGSNDPMIGTPCDGADLDGCQDDTFTCTGAVLDCSAGADNTEVCNGADDDCDSTIDEDASCPCRLERFATHVYLFCPAADWYVARDGCPTGYALTKIDSPEEQSFVAGITASIANVDFWIGATDEGMPTDYRWIVDNSEVPNPTEAGFQNWGNLDAAGDCVELDGDMSVGPRWSWNDTGCAENDPYICETRGP